MDETPETPPNQNRLGARDKLSAATVDTIIEAVRRGNVFDRAATLAHISRATFYRWVATGRDLQEARANGWQGPLTERDDLMLRLAEGVDVAEALAEDEALQTIRRDGATGARWLLERKYPDRYGRRHRLDIGNADGQPFRLAATPTFDPDLLTTEELETVARLLRKATPKNDEVIELESRRELTA